MIKFFLIFLIIFCISLPKIQCRKYLSVIGSDRHTNWGNWHSPVFCPGNSFAVGVDLKFERYQWAGDDTHLNAIRLTCDDTASTTIQSGEGPYGSWFTSKGSYKLYFNKRSIENATSNSSVSARAFSIIKFLPDILGFMGQAAQVGEFFTKENLSNRCDNMGKFIGFNFEVEPPIRGDDTAGNKITMYCEGEGSVWYDLQIFGRNIRKTTKYCPDGQAICGIRTQIEPKIKGDNTALNNVDFYCCKNYYKLFNIATKRVLDSDFSGRVFTLDDNDSLHQRWEVINHDDKFFSLKNAMTGLILDSNRNGNVYAISYNGGDNQKWFKDDKNRIVNKATNRALDSNHQGSVYTFEPNTSNHQLWFRR